MFKSINPYTQQIIAEYPIEQHIEPKIEATHQAYQAWRKVSLDDKVVLMRAFADQLEANLEDFAQTITLEMGKIERESIAEIKKCIITTRFYCDHAHEYLQNIPLSTRHKKAYIAYDPQGIILAIMPWNFPLWQAIRFAVPNLLLGNGVLLKHAPNVLGSALNIEKAFIAAGFPKAIFQCINIDLPEVENVIAHPHVKGVTLTGSNRAGSSVAALAGKYFKKSVLELGGSDPFVVLNDANIQEAVEAATQSRYQNAGQTCIAAKRWIVQEDVYDEFKEKALAYVKQLVVGDPLDPKTDMGPLARMDLADNVEKQVRDLLKQGAHKLTEWSRENCLVQPQLLEISPEIARNFTDELFGPVGLLIKVKDAEEALTVANETPFGLGASVWTTNRELGEYFMREIHAGSVFLNGMMKSEGAIPFGGTNQSGYGKELGFYGMHEFANIKSYIIHN